MVSRHDSRGRRPLRRALARNPGGCVMAKNFRALSDSIDQNPVRRARIEEMKRAMYDALTLAKLREDAGVTQNDMAQVLGVSQSNVSHLESRIKRQEDLYLSTLSEYVAALGGHLELTAVFPDRRVLLGVDAASVPQPA